MNKLKATILFFLFLILIACNLDSNSDASDIIYVQENTNDFQVFEQNNLKLETKESLFLFLDSVKLIGFNDKGYKAFVDIFSCHDADSIARDMKNAKLSLYAFYYVFYEECQIDLDESLKLVEHFKQSSDTINIWLTSSMMGETTLRQEAATCILHDNRFSLNSEQEKYLLKILGY